MMSRRQVLSVSRTGLWGRSLKKWLFTESGFSYGTASIVTSVLIYLYQEKVTTEIWGSCCGEY